MTPQDVAAFWEQAGPERWFKKDAAFDGALSVRFGEALKQARLGTFDDWGETPEENWPFWKPVVSPASVGFRSAPVVLPHAS